MPAGRRLSLLVKTLAQYWNSITLGIHCLRSLRLLIISSGKGARPDKVRWRQKMERSMVKGITGRIGSQRGFVLLAAALGATALIGMLGLAFDLGHVYITKNEAQA